MEKLGINIRITPATREKLVKIRKESGVPYGAIVDYLVADVDVTHHQLFFGVEAIKSVYKIVDGVVAPHNEDDYGDYPFECTEAEQKKFDGQWMLK